MKLLEIKDHAQAPPLTSIRELRMAPSTLASGPIFSMNALYTTPTVCGGPHLIRPTEGVSAPSEPFPPCMPRLPTHLQHLYMVRLASQS